MVKKGLFGVLLLFLIILIVSCSTEKPKAEETCSTEAAAAVEADRYTALLYANGAGGTDDTLTPLYAGKPFFETEKYKKENQSRKTETVLGKTWNVGYCNSLKSDYLSYDLDSYDYTTGIDCDYLGVFYRTDTGRIVKYKTNPSPESYEGCSINRDSSEEAIVSYAKSVLMEVSGESADGWNAKVTKSSFPYYRPDTMGPLFADGCTVTFYKTIGGVERGDRMYVSMTDAGEIVELYAVNYEDVYAPFNLIQPDLDAIKQTATASFTKGIACSHSEITDVALFVCDNSLFAQVCFSYQIDEARGSVVYVVQVAQIQ